MLGLGGGWSHVDHVEPLPGKNFPLSGKSSLMATLTRSWLRDVYPIWEDWLVWIFLTDHSLQLGQSHNLIIGLSFIFNSFLTSQWVWAWSLGWDYNSFKSTLTSYWGSSAYHNTSRKNKGRLHKKYVEFSTQRHVGKKSQPFSFFCFFFLCKETEFFLLNIFCYNCVLITIKAFLGEGPNAWQFGVCDSDRYTWINIHN